MLQEGAGVAHHGVAQTAQLGNQRARRHDVAQAQRGRQTLGDRAHVNHAPHFVQAFERGHGFAGVQVLGLVVVLNHYKILLRRLAQQQLATLQAQGAGGGTLVGGRDKHVVQRWQALHHQAVRVYRHWHTLGLAQGKAVARMRVAGLFQANALGLVKQGFGQQVVGVLGAHGDDDFFWQGKHAALGQQAQADLLNQLGHVAEFKVRRPVRQMGARQAVYAALPKRLRRKQQRIEGAVDKRVGVFAPLVGFGQGALIGQRAQHASGPVGRLKRSTAGCAGKPYEGGRRRLVWRLAQGQGGVRLVGDKHATARARFDEAVVHQLRIGRGDGVAAQAQHMGQLARRRQQGAHRQAAVQNGLHHGQAQALLQGQSGLVGQGKQAFPLGVFGSVKFGHGPVPG